MEIKVGEKYTFHQKRGRGRPYVGTVLKKKGILTEMQTLKGDILVVQTKYIHNPYTFRPYNKAKVS